MSSRVVSKAWTRLSSAAGQTPSRCLGDFQTPIELALDVWRAVDLAGLTAVIEPTVGVGNFITTAPSEIRALPWHIIDVNSDYLEVARNAARSVGVTADAHARSAFGLRPADLGSPDSSSSVLVVGNPPWVTNSEQGALVGKNVPSKRNHLRLSGLDAMTGKSNFDIAEAVLLSVLAALEGVREVRVALLMKRSVALKVGREFMMTPGTRSLRFSTIDARRWFGASVEAGLFEMVWEPRSTKPPITEIQLAESLSASRVTCAGLVNGNFAHDVPAYWDAMSMEASGDDGLVWRQGLKHDAARVLELRVGPTGLVNGDGEVVDVEPEVLCPLYKSSDIANVRPPSRVLPLYQFDLSGPDRLMQKRWPKLAAYLDRHRDAFDARKSKIYAGKDPFMLFGVGKYTSAPFKVAVSGLYKSPRFSVLRPSNEGAPPLVDDTCYLLPFDTRDEAEAVADYLNSPETLRFLAAICDITAKRPYTAAVLRRIKAPADLRPLTLFSSVGASN